MSDTHLVSFTDSKQTPLHHAAIMGNFRDVKRLFHTEKREIINSKDTMGRTPFFWACHRGSPTTVCLFLGEIYVDVNKPDNYGISPIAEAAKSGNLKAISYIIASGREVIFKDDKSAADPFQAANDFEKRKCSQLLELYKKNPERVRESLQDQLKYNPQTSFK